MTKNTEPAPAKPDDPPTNGDAAAAYEAATTAALAFLEDWRADVPAEAATGQFAPTVRDRWHDRAYPEIPDGYVIAGGWAFVFYDGRFRQAQAIEHVPPFYIPRGQIMPVAA